MMSRIQAILDKADLEGGTRRTRHLDVGRAPAIAAAGLPRELEPDEAPVVVGTLVPARLIAGARLDARLITTSSPLGATSEQYRALRTRLLQIDAVTRLNVVLVTSPGRGEGKTLTATNLALAMAQADNRRVCLVDADLRNPQLHALLGLPDGPGLGDVLAGSASLEDALVILEEHQITVLPAGRVPSHPAELLTTTAMQRTIEALRGQYDRILIDVPPVGPLADVSILSPLVDAVLLVVRSGITSKPAIRDALAALDRSKLAGLVLNESA